MAEGRHLGDGLVLGDMSGSMCHLGLVACEVPNPPVLSPYDAAHARRRTTERAARSTWGLTGLAVAGLTAFLSLFVMVGADCYWLVAMGDHIVGKGRVPTASRSPPPPPKAGPTSWSWPSW